MILTVQALKFLTCMLKVKNNSCIVGMSLQRLLHVQFARTLTLQKGLIALCTLYELMLNVCFTHKR